MRKGISIYVRQLSKKQLRHKEPSFQYITVEYLLDFGEVDRLTDRAPFVPQNRHNPGDHWWTPINSGQLSVRQIVTKGSSKTQEIV